MKRVYTRAYNKSLERSFDDHFEIETEGAYLVEITASAQSWWQNSKTGRSFLNKDSLTVKINSKEITGISRKRKLLADDLWNGNVLKSADQTAYVIVYLKKGNALISFKVHGAPFLNGVNIYLIRDSKVLLEKLSPSRRERIPWLVFLASEGISFQSISIDAKADVSGNDDEDLQLIIDGNKQYNPNNNTHREWYWCGYALHGSSSIFKRDFDITSSRIDIIVDGSPHITKLSLDISTDAQLIGTVALYKDIEETDFVRMREEPKTDAREVMRLKTGDVVEILERIVVGEKVLNKSNIWHKVKYGDIVGYILSTFIEIRGEERERIIDKIRESARTNSIDENIAVTLAGCESHYKPYAVSYTDALSIFQLTGIAREDLAKRFNYEIREVDSFDVDRNIEGGIRYLKWIVESYRGSADADKKILAAWNAGTSLIPIKGRLNLDKLTPIKKSEVEQLIGCVGKNKRKKAWRFIASLCIGFLLFIGVSVFALNEQYIFPSAGSIDKKDVSLKFAFYRTANDSLESILVYEVSEKPFMATSSIQYVVHGEKRHIDLVGFPVNASFLGSPYLNEIFFIAREEGHQITTSLLRYDRERSDLVFVPFISAEGVESTDICCGYVTHEPRDNGVEYNVVMYENDNLFNPAHGTRYEYDYNRHAYVEKVRWIRSRVVGN